MAVCVIDFALQKRWLPIMVRKLIKPKGATNDQEAADHY